MDRNQAIGLVLISLIVLLYFEFFAPKTEDLPLGKADTTVVVQQQPSLMESGNVAQFEESDSVKQLELNQKYGQLASLAQGTEEDIVVENKNLRLTFSNKGAKIKSVELRDFKTWQKQPAFLFDEETSDLVLSVNTSNGPLVLNDLYFKATKPKQQFSETDTLKLSFSLPGVMDITYRIPPKGYVILTEQKRDPSYLSDNVTQFNWRYDMKRMEQNIGNERTNSTIQYYVHDDEMEDLSPRSSDPEKEAVAQQVDWFSFKQQFFTSSLIADEGINNAVFETSVVPEDSSVVKLGMAQGSTTDLSYNFYFGPNNYQIMKKVTPTFAKNVYLGFPVVSWFNKWLIIPTFNFLENYTSNYGLIIILLVLFIKILLTPLSYKSYVSMAKMKVINNLIKPQLDAFKEKNGEDMQKVQQEQMRLYQELGVSPLASLSGCVPMLLQMPILFAMFTFFPNSIELRQESFLWAHDLSTYDSILALPFTIPFYGNHVSLFTLLMTASTLLLTKANSQSASMTGPMKTIQYIMPIMFLFVLNGFAAALTFYYFVANLVTFAQQGIIKKYFIDDEKILKKFEENRKTVGTKKKSKFQQRIEDAMKAKEEAKKKK